MVRVGSWGDPHALEFGGRVLVKLEGAAADWLLAQPRDQQQAVRRREFVRMRRYTERWVEPGLEALVEFSVVLGRSNAVLGCFLASCHRCVSHCWMITSTPASGKSHERLQGEVQCSESW
jgi:hypothetical protein